ncbi:hypothetical protein D3C72_1714400 [compost metagenome]
MRKVQRHFLDLYAVLGEPVQRMFKVFRGREQRLARDAADVQAGAPEPGLARAVSPFLDAGHGLSQLCCADRRDIAAWAGTDHDHVKISVG